MRGLVAALAIVAGGFGLTGCKTAVDDDPMDVVRVQDAGALTGQRAIRLRSGDMLEIRLGGVPPDETVLVNGAYTVDGEGNVNMPQIGAVKAAGLTQMEVQSAIQNAYRTGGIYSAPTVSVSVPMDARFVNVGGEVKVPQRVPYTTDLTILTAITAAGGFTEYASQSRVRLLRGEEVMNINIKQVRRNPGLDIVLEPGDSIEVMRSFF